MILKAIIMAVESHAATMGATQQMGKELAEGAIFEVNDAPTSHNPGCIDILLEAYLCIYIYAHV